MKVKLFVILIAVGLIATMTVPAALAVDTRTPGYWKTHPDQWILHDGISEDGVQIWIGELVTKDEALAILKAPVKGDARINLQQKLIALALSMGTPGYWDDPALFPDTPTLLQLYKDACAFLQIHASPLKQPSADRSSALLMAGQIDDWLNYYDVD